MSEGTVGFLARHRQQRVPELTERLVHTIVEQNPGYAEAQVVPLTDLQQSCRDNIARVLQLLARAVEGGCGDVFEERFLDAARATGQRRAEQGLPLDDVLRSFRVGGRLIWEDLMEQAHGDGGLDPRGVREVGTWLWEVVDETSAQVASAYHAAERRLVREDEQRRAALWEGLLHGRAQDPAFALEAARILDLPVRGRYAVIALAQQDGVGDVAAHLAQRLALRGVGSAWHRRGEELLAVLALGEVPLTVPVEVLGEWSRGAVGVSTVVGALGELEVAHRQASLARRTVAPGGRAVVAFDDCLPDALLLRSPDVAARLVESWLAPVLALPRAEARVLLQTVEMWVETAGSTSRTADLAHCHRNTVVNRLRRVGEFVGRELVDTPPPLELALALRAYRLRLGP
jgi:hypothetical protein